MSSVLGSRSSTVAFRDLPGQWPSGHTRPSPRHKHLVSIWHHRIASWFDLGHWAASGRLPRRG